MEAIGLPVGAVVVSGRAWGKANQATRYESLLGRDPTDVPEK